MTSDIEWLLSAGLVKERCAEAICKLSCVDCGSILTEKELTDDACPICSGTSFKQRCIRCDAEFDKPNLGSEHPCHSITVYQNSGRIVFESHDSHFDLETILAEIEAEPPPADIKVPDLSRYSLTTADIAEYNAIFDDLNNQAGPKGFELIKQSLRQLTKEYRELAEKEAEEIAYLYYVSEQQQMHAFLKNCSIEKCGIAGIGNSKILALKTLGVNSAYDVEYERVLSVPGIGDALGHALTDWKYSCQKLFEFDRFSTELDAEKKHLKAKFLARKHRIATILMTGRAQLRMFKNDAPDKLTKLYPRLEKTTQGFRKIKSKKDFKRLHLLLRVLFWLFGVWIAYQSFTEYLLPLIQQVSETKQRDSIQQDNQKKNIPTSTTKESKPESPTPSVSAPIVPADNQELKPISFSKNDEESAFKALFGVYSHGKRVKTANDSVSSVWFSQQFQHENNWITVVFIKTQLIDERGNIEDCHACSADISAVTYKQVNNAWQLIAKQTKIAQVGSWGDAPSVQPQKILKLTSDKTAVLIDEFYEGQGQLTTGQSMLLFTKNNWSDAGLITTAENNAGDCGEVELGMHRCTGYEGKLSVITGKKDYPDLLVTKIGTITDENDNLIPAKNDVYVFNGKQYELKQN